MPHYDRQTALIVVDVQNDFADPAGALYVQDGESVALLINEQVRQAGDAGALIVYSQDWHPQSTPHFQKDGGIWPVHCIQDTWGAAFFPSLKIAGEVVRKGTGGEDGYSAFGMRDPVSGETQPTGLQGMLQRRGIRRVVVAGLATDYCVKETVLDALRHGFETTVLTAAVRAVDLQPGDGPRAIDAMRKAGALLE